MDDNQIRGILQQSYAKETTRSTYLQRLIALQRVCNGVQVYHILSDPEQYYPLIRNAYPNITTRKNVLTLILALFKNSDKLRTYLKTQQVRWAQFHDNMDAFQQTAYKKNMPNPDQLAKYTPWEEITLKYKELKKRDPHSSLGTSIEFILLSIISSTPPKRSDYGNMRIFYDKDPNLKDANYIVLRQQRSYMVFTKYKTSDEYARVDEELPLATEKDVKDSIRRHPRTHLFVNRFGNPFTTNKAFSKFVIRVFEKHFQRSTGVTMLRHIFITDTVSWDNMSDEKLATVANQMMHSSNLQRKYHWSKEAICENMKRICPDC